MDIKGYYLIVRRKSESGDDIYVVKKQIRRWWQIWHFFPLEFWFGSGYVDFKIFPNEMEADSFMRGLQQQQFMREQEKKRQWESKQKEHYVSAWGVGD